MRKKSSSIADEIVRDWNREKQFKEYVQRKKELENNKKREKNEDKYIRN